MSSYPTVTRASEPELASPERLHQPGLDDDPNTEGRPDGVSAHGLSSTHTLSPQGLSHMTAENEVVPLDFEAVVAEHGPYLWRVLRRLGVRPPDVEDVWQETFIVVHRKLDAFEGRSQLRTWLSAIAVRVASDYRNRAHRRREQSTDEVPDRGTAASQHEDLVEQERRALLDRLIGELKPEQREVIVLYEFAELPMQEVAEALGCPLQTAYSRLHAGRRALEQAARREQARRGGAMTYRSDPTRWSQAQLSSSEGAPEFLRDAFQAGAHEGPSDLQMRTLALKLTAIGTGTALAAGASAAHASATAAGKVATGGAFGAIKTGGALTLSKIAVSLALVGAASAGAVYFQRGSALQALAPSVHHLAPTESQVLATPVVVETLRASVTSPTPVKNTAVAVASLDKPALDKPAAAAHAHDEKPPSVTIGEADQAAPGSSLSTHGGAPVAVKSHRVVRQERRATSATSNEDDTIDLAAPAANKSATAARVSVAGERQQLSEIELLRNARSALAARPREAYRLAAEHKAFYPQGVFAQERDALAVEALQRGGDLELARQLAQSFVQRYPDSPHAHRFRETMNLP